MSNNITGNDYDEFEFDTATLPEPEAKPESNECESCGINKKEFVIRQDDKANRELCTGCCKNELFTILTEEGAIIVSTNQGENEKGLTVIELE